MEEEPACSCACIDSVGQAGEVDLPRTKLRREVHQLPNGPAQTIQLPDNQRVAGAQKRQRVCQTRPITAPATGMIRENPLATGARQRIDLEIQALVGGRDAGVANEHAGIGSNLIRTAKCAPLISRHGFRTPHVQVSRGRAVRVKRGPTNLRFSDSCERGGLAQRRRESRPGLLPRRVMGWTPPDGIYVPE